MRVTLSHLLADDEHIPGLRADRIRASVRALRDAALVNRHLAGIARPMTQERLVVNEANEAEGLGRLRTRQHRAGVRLLAVTGLSAEGDEEMAKLLPDMVCLRNLSWRLKNFTHRIALPASLRSLALADPGPEPFHVTFAADPLHLRGLFTNGPIAGAPEPFRCLTQLLILLRDVAEAHRYRPVLAAATRTRVIGVWAPHVQAITNALGDDFASTHVHLRDFTLCVRWAPQDAEEYTRALRLLPTSIRELHFIGNSDDHAHQIGGLAQFVVALRGAWAGDALATRIAGRIRLLGVSSIGACSPSCRLKALRAELEQLCRTRSGPAVQVLCDAE